MTKQPSSREVLMSICEGIIDLVERKSQDYGQHDPERALYFPFGNTSYAQMEFTKMQRIMSLVQQEAKGGVNPVFEPLEDSVRDLVAYALFHLAFLRKRRMGAAQPATMEPMGKAIASGSPRPSFAELPHPVPGGLGT